MNNRTYVDPSVKLINSTFKNLGYYLWLKSRQWVIKDTEGKLFMRDFEIDNDWYQKIPNNFYVGKELVNKDDYLDRITGMRLQYLNFDSYVFEINGSCLLRDFLYNINKAPQFAQSNRFLFSILDENARFNSENYHISSEYKDIPEWENQFDKYIETINQDPIVDHNRLQMPYSISSTFWILINKNSLIDLLSFLKYYSPFLFEVYGYKFLSQVSEINESLLSRKLSPQISQYILKSKSDQEYTEQLGDTVVMNLNMSLILYSQFIRQTDCVISGYYNLLMHDNPNEFKHKVFKGDTTFMIHYVADIDKVRRTITNRLCAFAMSSNDGPSSWNYFIKRFLPDDLTPKIFMELLPCKFKDNKLINCKFYDDVKFRNEGDEISNCPCPLVNLDMKSAIDKLSRDNNKIGKAYYDLTNYLRYGGLKLSYSTNKWDSILQIYCNENLSDSLIGDINHILNSISESFDPITGRLTGNASEDLFRYSKYSLNNDMTCMMKGYAIDIIRSIMDKANIDKYIIDFGGDIYGNNVNYIARIDGTSIDLTLSGKSSVFTSGNTEKRGNHVVGGKSGHQYTTVIIWNEVIDNVLADVLATKHFANEKVVDELIAMNNVFNSRVYFIDIDETGKLLNKTYCASPFFNDYQIKVRDDMIKGFVNIFRPDLTESSKLYDNNHNDQAINVVNDNISGITESDYLVYPVRTDDLGTLFEVGVALAINHPIIKYNGKNLTFIFDKVDKYVDPNSSYLFDCSDKKSAVEMGYVSQKTSDNNIYYKLKGAKDNIMLSVKYNHVELVNGKYKLKKRLEDERDC